MAHIVEDVGIGMRTGKKAHRDASVCGTGDSIGKTKWDALIMTRT